MIISYEKTIITQLEKSVQSLKKKERIEPLDLKILETEVRNYKNGLEDFRSMEKYVENIEE